MRYGANFANRPDIKEKPIVTAGLEVRITAAACDCCEHTRHNRKRPTARDHHPTGAFGFRALEQDVRDDSVAKQYQYA